MGYAARITDPSIPHFSAKTAIASTVTMPPKAGPILKGPFAAE